jgi:hypothetical protein
MKYRIIAILTAILIPTINNLPAYSRKVKVGDYYCGSDHKIPIYKAEIKPTPTGFNILLNNQFIVKLDENRKIIAYGDVNIDSHGKISEDQVFITTKKDWNDDLRQKPELKLEKNGNFKLRFFANGCGVSSASGNLKFIGNTKTKIFKNSANMVQLTATDDDDMIITQVQTKTCQLLDQDYTLSRIVAEVTPDVKKLGQEFIVSYSSLSRRVHGEIGTDVEIVTRRMIGGAIKRDCPQYENKLSDYYKNNNFSNKK